MNPIMFGDLSSDTPGLTIRQKNTLVEHKIPLGSLVEVRGYEWHGDGAVTKYHARLYVVEHTRDCDGTPLYSLCEKKSYLDERKPYLSDTVSFGVSGLVKTIVYRLKTGFIEEQLTVIEPTQAVLDGYDTIPEWKQ